MPRSRYRYLLIYSFLIIIVLLAIAYTRVYYQPERLWNSEFERFERVFSEKIDLVYSELAETDWEAVMVSDSLKNDVFTDLSERYEKKEISFYLYTHDSLVMWSSNRVSVDSLLAVSESGICKWGHGYYFVLKKSISDSLTASGVLLIKNEFPFHNEYIKDGFSEGFGLDETVTISLKRDEDYPVCNAEGRFLFSLKPGVNLSKRYAIVLSLIYVILMFVLWAWVYRVFALLPNKYQSFSVFVYISMLVFVRNWMLSSYEPSVFYQLELFQPHLFAASAVLPNLGDFLLHILFFVSATSIFYRYFAPVGKGTFWGRMLVSVLGVCIVVGVFTLVVQFITNVVLHSSISFEVHHFFGLSAYSFVVYLSIFFLLFLFLLVLDKIWCLGQDFVNPFYFVLFIVTGSIVVFIALYLWGFRYSWFVYVFYGLLLLCSALLRFLWGGKSHTGFLLIVFIGACFTVAFVSELSHRKEIEERKVLAVNLSNERDQIAEMIIQDLEPKIQADTVVLDLMEDYLSNEAILQDYLQRTYFYGYLRKFELQISVCAPYDELTLIHDNSTEVVHCYSFFEDLVKEQGVDLPGSRFVFVDNLNGQISYLGKFVVPLSGEYAHEASLFISLDSRLISEELGYPELLLDERMNRHNVLSGYSYAKYREDLLTTRSGAFSYQLSLPEKWQNDKEFLEIKEGKFSHLFYRQDDENCIVISRQAVNFVDYIAAFSYVFVFFYLVGNLLLFLLRFPGNLARFRYDFKNRIKVSIIGLLILSLIIVGAGTIYYNIIQYRERTYQEISEKLQSVLVEMEQKLGGEPSLHQGYADYLRYLLSKFSNVFYVDINLYGVDGDLLASSREQVFDAGLLNRKMNSLAYRALQYDMQGRYIHKERIEKMEYYSAYLPFKNDANELLAYINLPYFTKQREMKEEVYTIIVAVVNVYFFLILLSTIVAVLVTNRVTRPLQLLQERLKGIRLGRHNEPLAYSSDDEIGELVEAYNRMVGELELKANELAQSEREMAWREMAKQIAHEIKNPLTPMKLSVQYLKRAWDDGANDFNSRISRFSNSMVGQINNLSAIASAFSNFARMPKARNERVDVVVPLTNAIALYGNTENVEIISTFDPHESQFVFADKEQLLIVFSNLLKNAIQAIPAKQHGRIEVDLTREQSSVIVRVSDNGQGITADVQKKLFQPNFTTKGSGMGLGLAIVKNIIENANGVISYQTFVGQGTTFVVRLPYCS